MKKAIISFLILLSIFCLLQQALFAVPAYPKPVTFTQPDGTTIKITLKGDERVKWAITSDGYAILFNDKGFYEYAMLNHAGDLIVSGIKARDPEKRSAKEKKLLIEDKERTKI
ncbi:hypothetical protein ES705_18264 [subsurface metagenome]